jgi:cell division protein ZapB
LTGLDSANYSALMEPEFAALEERIRQAAELCRRLRAENSDLRQRVVQLQNENRHLAEKISGAQLRLEGLLEQIAE